MPTPCAVVLLLLSIAMPFAAFAQSHHPVLMISIDGMRPDYVTEADKHGLKLPHLRQFLIDGSYATGVRGVFPTVTYPSHTTLVTGVPPAEHGIVNNQVFDPENRYGGDWYWYSDAIKVPTLWDAAHAAGLRTASLSWPVTVDNNSIDDNLPEYWRGTLVAEGGSPDDRFLMNAISRPVGALAEMQARLGPYLKGNETTPASDGVRTRFAVDILRRRHPAFFTVHLSSLDEEEHLHGPFSPEANADLELIDAYIGELMAAAREADPATNILVVSDHGFAAIHTAVDLFVPFEQAGLLTLGKPASGSTTPTVTSWKADPWVAGAMVAVMLHDSSDGATRAQVKALLSKLAADPANGIERVYVQDGSRNGSQDEIAPLGAFPGAAFLVTFRLGYVPNPSLSGPLQTTIPGDRGTHGYPPDDPEMYSSFFAIGPEVAQGKDLGHIDMRQIAPTVARLLGVTLPSAKATPLPLTTGAAH